ncbi:MAG: C1 family peptidase, partial [Methylococcales bacterium]
SALAAQRYKIATIVSSGGKVTTSTGAKTVVHGGSITFYFRPSSAAFEISSVKIDNVLAGKPSQITFSDVRGNHKLAVVFKKKRFQVLANIQGAANGALLPRAGDYSLAYGASKTFTAKPKRGYLAQFIDNGAKVAEGKLNRPLIYKVKRVTAHHNLQVYFVPPGGVGNLAPLAYDLSQTADPSLPYQQLQLQGSDPDHDAISFALTSPSAGTGYDLAYLSPDNGVLYMSLSPGFQGTIPLSFQVSDGKSFSNTAQVSLLVQPQDGNKGLGALDTDAKQYAGFDRSRLSSTLLGTPGAAPKEPAAVDLSANFPTPGNQGSQGSCVAWAAGYALKSYQEGIEESWSLNTTSHLFSPAYIYNQTNNGQDGGSQIYAALDLIIEQGAATLASAPYSDNDFLTQPSAAARAEAAKFKGLKRTTLSNLSDVKGALAQHKPVVLGIEVFNQFYNLSGPNSVYNSNAGSNTGQHGRHAVTAVGYDNNKFGGAVKVINSWGTGWGDKGYFWLPYDFFPTVTFQMWVLDDNKNENVVPTPDPVPTPVNTDLADMQVKNWSANLDYTVGGQGELEYTIINSGLGTVQPGASVSLMLSKDAEINANDTVVVYEQIPFDLKTGETAYRSFSDSSDISFQIPPTLDPGVYYMGMVVDDLNQVQETDEANNVSLSEGTV